MMAPRSHVVPAVLLVLAAGCDDDPSYDCIQCGDECVYTDMDPNHCGSCDNACHPAQTCQYGECVCPDGGEVCGDACVDTQTDPYNCGECATACAVGSACTDGVCDEQLTAYGNLDVDFTTGYIYDGPMWEMDLDYRWEHFTEGVVRDPVFTGSYGDGNEVPDADTASSITHAEHRVAAGGNPAFVTVVQESFGDAAWTVLSNPDVRLEFASDVIEPGSYELGPPGDPDHARLYLYDVLGMETLQICILAVTCDGAIQVTEATSTTAIEGGTLSLSGSDIELYHPSSTPLGDLRDRITALELTVCPMR